MNHRLGNRISKNGRARLRSNASAAFTAVLLAGSQAIPAEEVWIGPVSGNWSNAANWLDGSAPSAGGDPGVTLRFTNPGNTNVTATNDLPGAFVLNRLLLDNNKSSVSLTLAGASTLQFAGASPEVSVLGTGDEVISSGLVLNPSTGSVRLTGGGLGNLTIAGTIGQANGPAGLVIAAAPGSPNVQTISLNGANTFSGGVVLQSGNLQVGTNTALGTGTFTVNGGTVRFGNISSPIVNSVALGSELVVQMSSTVTVPSGQPVTTLSGVISSIAPSAGLSVRSTNATLRLTGASTYSGATVVDSPLSARLASSNGGNLLITGGGSILNTSVVRVNAGASVQLDTASSGSINRIGDSTPIELRNGKLTYNGITTSGSTPQVETIGALSGAGYSTVAVANSYSPSVRLVSSGLNRVERGTFLFAGSKLGNAFGAQTGNIVFSAPPSGLIGGTAGSSLSILPYAIGDTNPAGGGASFVTYDAVTGIRPLNIATEYSSDLAAAAATTNVRLTTTTSNNSARTINSLALASGSVKGSGSITIASGAVLATGTGVSVANNLSFGAAEANIFAVGDLDLQGMISGSGGLTKSGGGKLTLSGINTFTGTLTINAGQVSFANRIALGGDDSAIVFNGQGARLSYTGNADLNLNRGFVTGTGVARVETVGTGDLTLSGVISGQGGMRFSGSSGRTITLTKNNTYSGPTLLAGGAVRINNDAAFGSGGDLDFGGGNLVLGGAWSTNREISVSSTAQIDTAGNSASLNGLLTGSAALRKAGAGVLELTSASPFSGSITVVGGTLKIAGTGFTRSTSYAVTSGAELTLDYAGGLSTDRMHDSAIVTLTGGDFRLQGSEAASISEVVNWVAAGQSGSAITLVAPGSRGVTLQVGTLTANDGDILLRGTNLGGATGGYSRIVVTKSAPSTGVVPGIYASNAPTGFGTSFAIYDSSTDSAGVIGFRPLRDEEYANGTAIANPANGGIVAESANYLVEPGTTATGTTNTVNSLTVAADGGLTLAPNQTLTIATGGILVRSGSSPAILSGGTLAFGNSLATIYNARDVTLSSTISGTAGFRKSGPGVLTFNGTAGYTGTTTVASGTLRAGGSQTFAEHVVEVANGGVFDASTLSTTVGALQGTGEVAIGTSALTVGSLGQNFRFDGGFSGSGVLRIVDGGNPTAERTFSGTSTFTGAVTIESGCWSISSPAALGVGQLIINGGSLWANSSTTLQEPLQLNKDLLVYGNASTQLNQGTTVSGNGAVVVRGKGGLIVNTPLTVSSGIRSDIAPDDHFPVTPGPITIAGAQGAIASTTGINVGAGSLVIDDAIAFTGGAEGRIGDSTPIYLNSTLLRLQGNSEASTTEAIGAVSDKGFSTIRIQPSTTAGATLTVAALDRVNRGTFMLSSSGVLGGGQGSSVGQIKMSTPPALIGGNGAGPAVSIVQWAVGANGTGNTGLVTYDANGFRPLAASEYATSLATAAVNDNVQLSASVTNDATIEINALVTGSSSLLGTGTLVVKSGVVLRNEPFSSNTPVINNGLSFGTAEAQFFIPASYLEVSGAISGSGGLTVSGKGALTLSGANTFSGPVTLNNATLNFQKNESLGAGNAPLALYGAEAQLRYIGGGAVTIGRDIQLQSGSSGLTAWYPNSTFSIPTVISGAGGLRISGDGSVVLSGSNTYTGPTFIEGGLAIPSDAVFGASDTIYFSSTSAHLRLQGPWVTNRHIEVLCPSQITTNGFDATINTPLRYAYPGALTKNGAGALILTRESDFAGAVSINGGSIRLANSGALATSTYTVSTGGELTIDNSAQVAANRVLDSASFILNGGGIRLNGNATASVSESIGAVKVESVSTSTVTLTAPGSGSTTLRMASLDMTSGSVVFRGDQLGGGVGNPFTRVVITNPPTLSGGLIRGVLAANSSSVGGLDFAMYDTRTDSAGVLGVRPLTVDDFTTGGEIRNVANGGSTPEAANYLLTGVTTVGGADNTVNSLTFSGSPALTLDSTQTLNVQSSGLLVRAGTNAVIRGGAVSLGQGTALVHTEGSLLVQSQLNTSSLLKSGPGTLTLQSIAPYAGTINVLSGILRVASTSALADAHVTLAPGTTLDFTPYPANVGNLVSQGNVTVVKNPLRASGYINVTGGDITGSGGVVAGNGISSSVPLSYSGATTVSNGQLGYSSFPSGLKLYDAGTALNTSSISASRGALVQLDNSNQILNRIGVIPVSLNSSRMELIGGTLGPVVQNVGILTGTGYSSVNVSAFGARSTTHLAFAGLQRQDRGTFHFYGGDLYGPSEQLGNGHIKLTFGAELAGSLVGAGTTPTNRGILPFAVSGFDLATYDPVSGIRPLSSAEYASTLENGENVSLGSIITNNAIQTVNALKLTSPMVFGTGTIGISSGLLFASGPSSTTVYNNIDFGSAEANIFALGEISISGTVSGFNGLTKSGPSTLTLAGDNTFTGPLTINAGVVKFSQMSNLGTETSEIIINDGGTLLGGSVGAGAVTLTRGIRLNGAGFAGIAGATPGGGIIVNNPVTGTAGLSTSGNVTLNAVNTYLGDTSVSGSLTIASDAALGNGNGVMLNGTLTIGSPWNTNRSLSVGNGAEINTAGFDAVLNGALLAGEYTSLSKTGAGTLTINSASTYAGNITISAGAVRLDNSNEVVSKRFGNAGITLKGGEFEVVGNASTPTAEKLGGLGVVGDTTSATRAIGQLTLRAPGTEPTSLRFGSYNYVAENNPLMLIKATGLAGASRIYFDTAPVLKEGALPGAIVVDPAGNAVALATYDTGTDSGGVIGIRPLTPSEHNGGSVLGNPANGGTTPVEANFRAAQKVSVLGASNTVATLSFGAGGEIVLGEKRILNVSSSTVIVPSGAAGAKISGGTFPLGATQAVFFVGGDLTLATQLSGSAGIVKRDSGMLALAGKSVFTGTAIIDQGTLLMGANGALRGQDVTLNPGGILDLDGRRVSVGTLAGTGAVRLGAGGQLTLLESSSFGGSVTGAGAIRIGEPSLYPSNIFTPVTPLGHTGATIIESGSMVLQNGGKLTGTSAIQVNGGSSLTLKSSAQPFPEHVPISLNSSTLEVKMGDVTLSAGTLAGTGLSTVSVDHSTAGVQMNFDNINAGPLGNGAFVFRMSNQNVGVTPGAGVANLRFGQGLSSMLVGSGSGAASTPIIPFAIGSYKSDATAAEYGLLTYSSTNGLRFLDASEYSSNPGAGGNWRIPSYVENNTNVSVNSLMIPVDSQLAGTGTVTVASGVVLAAGSRDISNNLNFGSSTGRIFAERSNLAIRGVLSGTGGLVLNGPATIELWRENSFTGPLTLNNTTVNVWSAGSLGGGADPIIFNDSTLNSSVFGGLSIARPIQLQNGLARFYGSSSDVLTLSGQISGPGGLDLQTDTVISGANSFEGPLRLSRRVTFNSDAAFGATSKIQLDQAGIIFLAGPWTTPRNLEVLSSGNGAVDTNGFDAVVEFLTGEVATGFVKSGAGRLMVNDASAYRGSIQVNSGTLVVNGPAFEGSEIKVGASGTLTGAVDTKSWATISGTLSPGNGVGSIATGRLALLAGSTLEIQLGDASLYDQVQSSSVYLDAGSNLSINLAPGFDPADFVDQFTILLNTGSNPIDTTSARRFVFAGNSLDEGEQFVADGQLFQISYTGGSGNDVVLYAVPEPSAASLLLVGLLPLGWRRRKYTVGSSDQSGA